jgi:hypothetical protein
MQIIVILNVICAECHIQEPFMLSAIMLDVVMLSVVAPFKPKWKVEANSLCVIWLLKALTKLAQFW